jgi:hypothetical protein
MMCHHLLDDGGGLVDDRNLSMVCRESPVSVYTVIITKAIVV